jgi:hypothetical protein
MPANLRIPPGDLFADYLNRQLGGNFQVTYIKRMDSSGKQIDQDASFFHITETRNGSALSTNLRIDLRDPSAFHTDYGNGLTTEFAPMVMTDDPKTGYVVGSTWESTYVAGPQTPGGKRRGAASGDYSVQHQLFSPTESLSKVITTGFYDARTELRMGAGHVNVKSNIMGLLAAGANQESDFNVPQGALLVNEGTDRLATRRRGAQSFQAYNVYDQSTELSELEQLRRIREARSQLIGSGGNVPMFRGGAMQGSVLKGMGYAEDRDNPYRLVPYAHGYRQVTNPVSGLEDIEIYLPSEKMAKHRTILDTGRQQAVMLDRNFNEIMPGILPNRPGAAGYYQTNIAPGTQYGLGARVPSASLVMPTLFSTSFPVPGAGSYYPENMETEIGGAGYRKSPLYDITDNLRDLLRGQTDIRIGQKSGSTIPVASKWTYASIMTPETGGEYIDLSERMGSHSYDITGQRLRIPRYYNPTTGLGYQYNQASIDAGTIQEVTDMERLALSKRLGIPVEMDDTLERVGLEVTGMTRINAKIAASGIKSEIVPMEGRPTIMAGGTQLPIAMQTFEVKSMPEVFATSLAALGNKQQISLFKEYQRSLKASLLQTPDDVELQARISGVGHALTGLRRGDKLDFETLVASATASGNELPANVLGRDILERVILGGRSITDIGAMSSAELGALASSPQNIKHLQTYGMGFVSSEMSSPITERWHESQVQASRTAFMRHYSTPEGRKALGISPQASAAELSQRFYSTMGFDPANVVSGMRTRTYRPEGFMMPTVAVPAAEFAGGGRVGGEEMQLLNNLSRTFSSNLGLSLKDLIGSGAWAMNRQNDPVRWAQTQVASIMMNEAGERVHMPNAIEINEPMAARMLANPDMLKALSRSGANMAGMQQFGQILSSYFPEIKDPLTRPITFKPARGHYMPSLEAVGFLATEDVATMGSDVRTGEDVTRTWNMYQGAFYNAIQATRHGDPGGVLSGTGRLTQHFMNAFGLPEGSKKNAIKQLLSSNVAVTNARYSFWPELAQNEVYGSKAIWQTHIRQSLVAQGIEPSESEVADVYKYVSGEISEFGGGEVGEYLHKKGVPGAVWRWPILSGEESVVGVRLLTPEHLRRSGRNIQREGGMSDLEWRMGLGLSTMLGGDFDLDPLAALAGITARRDDKGILRGGLAGFTSRGNVDPALEKSIEALGKMPYMNVQRRLFESRSEADKYDPLLKAWSDRSGGGLAGVASMMSEQFGKSGFKTYSVLSQHLQNYAGAKMQMGTTYDYTRAIDAAAEVGGWTGKESAAGRRGRAPLYQPYLDLSKGVSTPLVNMFQTAALNVGTGGNAGQVGMTWGLPMKGITDNLQFFSRGTVENTLTEGNISSLVLNMAYTASAPSGATGEIPAPTPLARAFSPEGSRAFTPQRSADELANIEALASAYESAAGSADSTNVDNLREQYYKAVSLEEAIRRPWSQDTDNNIKQARVAEAIHGWTMANYGDRESQVFRAPQIQAMFGKALGTWERKNPGQTLPNQFLSTAVGQQLVGSSREWQPLFNLMRGRLFSTEKGLPFMYAMQQRAQAGANALTNWGLSVAQRLGLGGVTPLNEMGNLYDIAMNQPISIRASKLPGILHGMPGYGFETTGIGYRTETTTGVVPASKYGEQSVRETTAYMLAKTIGLPSSRSYEFTKMMFPQRDAEARFAKGKEVEAMLGEVMGPEQGWFTTHRFQRNEDTNELEAVEQASTNLPYQGAFLWRGQMGNEQAEFAATPDYLRLYNDQAGKLRVMAVEQKTPGPGKDQAFIESKNLPAYAMQARQTPWIINKLRGEILAGGETGRLAEASLRSTLGSYIGNDELSEQAYQSILENGVESQVFMTQVGTPLEQTIMAGAAGADRGLIQSELERQGNMPGYRYAPSAGGIDKEMRKQETYNISAVQRVSAGRHGAIMQLYEMIKAAPNYWRQAQSQVPGGASHATAITSLNTAQQVGLQMQAIALGAQAAGVPPISVPQGTFRPTPQQATQAAAAAAGAATSVPPSTATTPPGTTPPAPGGGGGTSAPAGAGGAVPPTPPTPPTPPAPSNPDEFGAVTPTAMAQAFMAQYGERKRMFMQQASALRTRLGGGPLGVAGEILRQDLTPEQIQQQYGDFGEIAAEAKKFVTLGSQVRTKMAQVDPSISGYRRLGREVEEATTTASPLGKDLTDLLSFLKLGGFKSTGKIGTGDMDTATAQHHFERLASVSEKLIKNFEDLSSGSKHYSDAKQEEVRLLAEAKVEQARSKISETAAPLVEGGLLQQVAPGVYRRTTAVPATAEGYEQLGKYEAARGGLAESLMDQAKLGVGPEEGKGMSGMLRRMLGGFGMMYMRSILNFATQGLDTGYQERVAMEGQFAGTASALSGGAILPRNQQIMMANRAALAGSDYLGMNAAQSFFQTTPGLADVSTMATAGLGAYAMATWAGSMGGPGGAGLLKYAPQIGGLIAGASLLAGGLQKSQDTEGIAYRYASATGMRAVGQAFSITDALGGIFSERGIAGVAEDAQSYANITAAIQQGLTPQGIAQTQRGWFTPTTLVGSAGAATGAGYTVDQATGQITYAAPGGGGKFATFGEQQAALTTSQVYMRTLRVLQGQNLELPSEAIAQAFQFAGMAGIPTNRVGEMAGFMTQTGLSPTAMSQMLSGFGVSQYRQYQGGMLGQTYLSAMGNVDALAAAQIAVGSQAFSQMGPASYFLGERMSPEIMMTAAQRMGQIAGTPVGDQYTREMALWQQQRQFGWNIGAPTMPAPDTTITQAQMGIQELREAQISGRITSTKQLGELYTRYLGYTPEQAQALQTQQAGQTEGAIQREIQRAEQMAGIVSTERILAPTQSEEYFASLSAQMMGLTEPQLYAETAARESLLGITRGGAAIGIPPITTAGWTTDILQRLRTGAITPDEASRLAGRVTSGFELGGAFATGWQLPQAQRTGLQTALGGLGAAGQLTPYMMNVIQGVSGFEPYAMTQAYAYGAMPGGGNMADMLGVSAGMVGRDIWGTGPMAGLPINLPAFTISGGTHPMFPFLQGMLPTQIGAGATGAGAAFTSGFQIPGTNIPPIAGMTGMQMYLSNLQANAQAASAGISLQQNALQMQYLPQMWGIQDQMINLGYEQQMWGFDRQRQGNQIQQRQFFQNFGMQQQQAMMQRGWTREDWAFQEQQRNQQWGWQVEDFQENLRFMTGRDRRLAQRQMGRQTLVHDQETEQIDKQRQRQEELWALEDQRFDTQVQQFMENQAFQEEGIARQQEFYEERFALERELTDLQRELQMKQLELSREQIAIQAGVAEEMRKANEIQMAVSALQLIQQTGWEQLSKLGVDFTTIFDEWLQRMLNYDWGSGGSAPTPPQKPGKGETTSSWSGLQYVSPSRGTETISGPTTVVVNIGNEEFKRYIVGAVVEEM